jgi:hypothetical protein
MNKRKRHVIHMNKSSSHEPEQSKSPNGVFKVIGYVLLFMLLIYLAMLMISNCTIVNLGEIDTSINIDSLRSLRDSIPK